MDPHQQPSLTEEDSNTNPDGTNNENASSSRRRSTPYDRRPINSRRRSTSFVQTIFWNTNFGPRSATSVASVIESPAAAGTSASSSATDSSCVSFDVASSTTLSGASSGSSTIDAASHVAICGSSSYQSLFRATTGTFRTISGDFFLGARSGAPAAVTSAANSGIRNRRNRHSITVCENINTFHFDNSREQPLPFDRSPIVLLGNAPHLGNNDGAPERPLQARRTIFTPLRIPYNQLPQRVESDVNAIARVQPSPPPLDAEDENMDIQPGPSTS